MIEVRRLRLLVELSRRGTIAAAASALHMSPSGISHQLSLLEREAGTALLQRLGRGIRLTEAGERLAARGAEILVALETARSELASPEEEPAGTLRVAAFASALRALIQPVIDCQAAHPALRVELVESEPEDAVPALLSGDFDLVVSEEYPGTTPIASADRLHRRTVGEDPLDVVLPADIWGGRDLARCGGVVPWALEPTDSASRAWAVQYCRGLGFTPDVQYESRDLALLLLLVRQGGAAAVLPRLALPPAADAALTRIETGWARTLVTVVRRGRECDPSLIVLRRALHEAFQTSGIQLSIESAVSVT